MMACALRGGVRRHSADAAHRARTSGSAGLRATGAGADDQRRPVVSGVRRAGSDASCSPSSPRSIVSRAAASACVSDPGLIAAAAGIPSGAERPGCRLRQWGIFLVGMLTIAQFSFWGNYLPRVYPTHLRGTGESFAANVGGRMIGTSRGAHHDSARAGDARPRYPGAAGLMRRRLSAQPSTSSGSSPASGCPSRRTSRLEKNEPPE